LGLVLLLDEGQWVFHVLGLLHEGELLLVEVLCLLDDFSGRHNVFLLLYEGESLHFHVLFNFLFSSKSNLKILPQLVQSLGGCSSAQFELQDLLVALFDVLDVLLVGNLHLMEINELEIITHLFLVLNLAFSLKDCYLKGNILGGQFVDEVLL